MDLAKKLQLQDGQHLEAVAVPESAAADLAGVLAGGAGEGEPALLVFVTDRAALARHRARITAAASADRLTWVSYPKAGQLGTDLNRDTLAALLEERGIRAVRQVAVNAVWSALRFRPG